MAKAILKQHRKTAPRAVSKASQVAYADATYQAAIDKVALKLKGAFHSEIEAARKRLSKQGIELTQDQVTEYYKRHLHEKALLQDATLSAEERAAKEAKRKADQEESARLKIKEASSILCDAFDVCIQLEGRGGHECFLDPCSLGLFGRLAIEEAGRKLKEALGVFGVSFSPAFTE